MKKFTTSVNGYNKNEVNDFVSMVIDEYEKLLNKSKEKDQQIAILKNKLEHYTGLEDSLNRAIYVAENSASEMRKAASNEAKMIIDDAKRNASRIVNDSLVKAAETDAQVDKLKTQIKIYKARIKQTIEEQLIMVDDIDKIEF